VIHRTIQGRPGDKQNLPGQGHVTHTMPERGKEVEDQVSPQKRRINIS